MTADTFSLLFVVTAALGLALRLALVTRQARHVAAHRAEVPEAFKARIDVHAHARAADYTLARMRAARPELLVSTAWVLVLTVGGLLQAVSDRLGGLFAPGTVVHGTAFLASLAVLGWLVDLPFQLYRTFGIEARFGFNRMTPRLFLSDTLKGGALSAAIGLPMIAGVLWLMGAMGPTWWLWVWFAWMAFNLLAMLIWPAFIAPLFNRFEPLADEALRQRIDTLLARCGFAARSLYVMDGSKRSAHGNAYFTGFGRTRRIVFFDTLLARLNADEIEAVLAHELGHFKLHHVPTRLALMAVASLVLMALLGWLADQAWFFEGLGMRPADTASLLALFTIAGPVFLLPATPLLSAWSRRHEYQADRYAAEHADAAALVEALVKLYRDNAATLTPDPWYSRFHDSHPPAGMRIAHLRHLMARRACSGG